jgi:NADH-quinone oxidoreductase subunit M
MSLSTITTVLIFMPLAAGLLLWLLPLDRMAAGGFALLVSLVEVGLWIEQAARFDYNRSGLQLEQRWQWFPDLHVSYHVGYYAFSVWLVGLTVVAMAACVAYGFWAGRERPRAYFGAMLFTTGAVVAVFVAQDLVVFSTAFEAMLIPLYVLIGVWGGPGRMGATLKFVVYTMAGSLLMLAAMIAYGLSAGTFDLAEAAQSGNRWIFLGFLAAFAVKAPLFPLHGWLPDAYRQSSPEVAAVLSGIVSKAGAYGMLRILLTKFPEPSHWFRLPILAAAAFGLVYGSLLAFRAPDFRGVVAYSSLAQMGLIVLGLFSGNDLGFDGAVLQMVVHGLVSTSLFLLAGMIERRTTTGEFALMGGLARGRPALATLVLTTGVIALAVPGSSAFAGEFLILAGAFQQAWWWAAIGAAGIVLAAMYMLRAISALLHERPGPAVTADALDLRPGELAIVVPLVSCLLALSIWPAAISHNSFGGDRPRQAVAGDLR